MTALRTRLGLEALSGERRALVEARLDDLYESRGGDRAWAEAAEGERPALVEAFEAAAREGHACAKAWLARMLFHGKGVAKDEAKAVECYTRAAEQATAPAQFNLGHWYRNGKGVAKDAAQAAVVEVFPAAAAWARQPFCTELPGGPEV